MSVSILNREAERLARDLARLTGETKAEAVTRALRDRLERIQHEQQPRRRLADELDEIALRCAGRPILDSRTPDEILGYDDDGLPR